MPQPIIFVISEALESTLSTQHPLFDPIPVYILETPSRNILLFSPGIMSSLVVLTLLLPFSQNCSRPQRLSLSTLLLSVEVPSQPSSAGVFSADSVLHVQHFGPNFDRLSLRAKRRRALMFLSALKSAGKESLQACPLVPNRHLPSLRDVAKKRFALVSGTQRFLVAKTGLKREVSTLMTTQEFPAQESDVREKCRELANSFLATFTACCFRFPDGKTLFVAENSPMTSCSESAELAFERQAEERFSSEVTRMVGQSPGRFFSKTGKFLLELGRFEAARAHGLRKAQPKNRNKVKRELAGVFAIIAAVVLAINQASLLGKKRIWGSRGNLFV